MFSERKEMIIEDLVTPWAQYEFRLQAVNEIGTSAPSEPSPRTNIPPDRPYLYPSNVGGGGGKLGDLTITWSVSKNTLLLSISFLDSLLFENEDHSHYIQLSVFI